jgi:outer membrane protein
MRLIAKILTVLLLTCVSSSRLFAADLSEIYDLAVKNDPLLAIAEATYRGTKETVSQARSVLLPQITLGASTSDNRRRIPVSGGDDVITDFNSHGLQASVTQSVFQLDRWYQFRQAKRIEAQARATFAAQQQDLILRVSDIYLNILEAADLLDASTAERDAVKRQLEQVQQRFDVGLVAITDVLESTAAFDTSTANVIEAEGAQRISFETLLRLTGQSFNNVATLSSQFPVQLPEPNNEDAWVKAALEQNYELQASRQALRAAEQELKAAKAAHFPSIDANITYTDSTTGGGDFFGAEQDTRSAALRLNVPIYQGGGVRSRVRQAAYGLEQAQESYDLTQKTVIENTRILYTAINTDVSRVAARLKGIESSQSALEATETGYEVGTRNIVDVLLVQQRLFEAQFRYASARYQYIKDTLQLKQLAGSLSPQDIYDLNKFLESNAPVKRTQLLTR